MKFQSKIELMKLFFLRQKKGSLTYIVLNLASDGKIRPMQAWYKQNSVTRNPISCKLIMNKKF